jgi:hypothetical protein
VNDGCSWFVDVLVTCTAYLLAEIHILTIHKVILAKAPNLLKHASLQHNTCARKYLHFLGLTSYIE